MAGLDLADADVGASVIAFAATPPPLFEPVHHRCLGLGRLRSSACGASRHHLAWAGNAPPSRDCVPRGSKHHHESQNGREDRSGPTHRGDTGHQQSNTQDEANTGEECPTAIVHAKVGAAKRRRELWILGVKRAFHLLEQSLFMLREGHGSSSPGPLRYGLDQPCWDQHKQASATPKPDLRGGEGTRKSCPVSGPSNPRW